METLSKLINQTGMRTQTITSYLFSELPEAAQIKVIADESNSFWYDFHGKERSESANKAEELYDRLRNIDGVIKGTRLYTWIINNLSSVWTDKAFCSFYNKKFTIGSWQHKYAAKYKKHNLRDINNLENCPLTGFCYDFDFLEPIISFLKNPDVSVSNLDLADSMPDIDDITQRDWEFETSEDFIKESLLNSDREFFEDGREYL